MDAGESSAPAASQTRAEELVWDWSSNGSQLVILRPRRAQRETGWQWRKALPVGNPSLLNNSLPAAVNPRWRP